MDDHRFDALSRLLGQGVNRRSAVAALAALAAGGVGEATATQRHHKHKHAKHKPTAGPAGQRKGRTKPPPTCSKELASCAALPCCANLECVNEVCAKPAPTANCPTDQVKCKGKCVDTSSDATNCGGCGVACPSGQTCQSGTCTSCTDKIRNGSETDVDCGGPVCPKCGTGKVCASGRDCETGACCDGVCADTSGDQFNCGDCSIVCASNQTCCGGRCGVPTDGSCGGDADCCSGACASGSCCASGKGCFGVECCANATAACTGLGCCETGITCGPNCCPDGTLCGEENTGTCCPVGRIGCRGVCCQSRTAICNAGECCESGVACGVGCCPSGEQCVDQLNEVCAPIQPGG